MKRQLTGIALVAALCLTGVATAGPAFAQGADDLGGSIPEVAFDAGQSQTVSIDDTTRPGSEGKASASEERATAAAASISIKSTSLTRSATSCINRNFQVKVAYLPAAADYARISLTATKGSKTIYAYSGTATVKNGINNLSAQLCGGSTTLGGYKTTATLTYYASPTSYTKITKVANKTVKIKGKPGYLSLSITGKAKANAKKRVTGTMWNTSDLRGKKLKVYFKASGKSKYKYVGKTGKINSKGKFSFVSKKLGVGRLYVKSYKTTYASASKSPIMKIRKTY